MPGRWRRRCPCRRSSHRRRRRGMPCGPATRHTPLGGRGANLRICRESAAPVSPRAGSDVRSQRWTGWARPGRRATPGTVAGERPVRPRAALRRRAPRRCALARHRACSPSRATYALTRGPQTPARDARPTSTRPSQQGIEKAQEDAAKAPPDGAVAYQDAPAVARADRHLDPPAARVRQGTGAGVVVNADGAVLTALHVVEGADAIEVTFADGTRSPRHGRRTQQPENDIAVLTPATLPQVVVPRCWAAAPQVGDPVFAVGHPLGLQRLPLRRRRLGARPHDPRRRRPDARGPHPVRRRRQPRQLRRARCSNRAGQVVGIVTGLANPSEQNFFVGIGFAVPIATAGGVAGGPPSELSRDRQRRADPGERMDTAPARARPAAPAGAGALRGQEDHRRAGRTCSSGCSSRCWPAATCSSRACRAWPRRWPSRRWPRPSAASSSGSSSRPDLVPADVVGTRIYNQRRASSRSRSARSSPTSCSPTRSTARRPRCRAPCSRSCRSGR